MDSPRSSTETLSVVRKSEETRERASRILLLCFVILILGACVAFVATCALERYHSKLSRYPKVSLRKRRFSSGDLLLLAPPNGRDPLEEKVSWSAWWRQAGIKLGTRSPFTHAAMVCRSPVDGSVWVWDITPQRGVAKTRLEDFFAAKLARKYEIGWRHLVVPRSAKGDFERRLWQATEDRAGTPYSSDFIGVWLERNSLTLGSTDRPPNSAAPGFPSVFPSDRRRFLDRVSQQGYFCSSLLANLLEELGVCDWHRAKLPGYWPFPRDLANAPLDVSTLPAYDWDPVSLCLDLPR